MKQRFLNQKLGKRMSRKVLLEKAKAEAARTGGEKRGARKPNPEGRTSKKD